MHEDHEQLHRDGRIPDALWEHIVPLLPPRKPHPLGCHRPRVDDRKAMDAIVFGLRTGCQGHALHETGLCSSRTAYRRFQEWTAADVFLRRWTQGLVADAARQRIDGEWLALDGAMTKAPLGGKPVGKNPTARDTLGTKRRGLTAGGGGPVGLAVDGANCHDFQMARATIESLPMARPEPPPDQPQGRCLDKGDDDDEVRELLPECGFTAHIRARGEEAKALKHEAGCKARRWVVERTYSGMNRFRRVLVRWDKNVRNSLGFLHVACAYITCRQAGLLG
jgi:putative transposase